jgi:membrane-associated phospholipid phosphatase
MMSAPPAKPLASPWTWGVPAVALLAGLVLWLGHGNLPLFRLGNQLGLLSNDALWANATLLGDTLVAFALLGLFAGRRPDIVWAVILAAVFTTLYVHGLKPLFHSPRPLAVLGAEQVHVIGPALRQGAFPSGHTAAAFTLAGVMVLSGVRAGLALGAVLVAALVGVSRLAVGAHWPLDVLGGMAGGWLGAALGVALARRWPQGLCPRPQWVMTLLLMVCAAVLATVYHSGYPQAGVLQRLIGVVCLGYGGQALVATWREHRKPG